MASKPSLFNVWPAAWFCLRIKKTLIDSHFSMLHIYDQQVGCDEVLVCYTAFLLGCRSLFCDLKKNKKRSWLQVENLCGFINRERLFESIVHYDLRFVDHSGSYWKLWKTSCKPTPECLISSRDLWCLSLAYHQYLQPFNVSTFSDLISTNLSIYYCNFMKEAVTKWYVVVQWKENNACVLFRF